MSENRLMELEIKVSYQEDLLQILNDIIAKQQQQIDRLEIAFTNVNERVKNLAIKMPDDSTQQNEIPPHY
jgi:SlyX protein